MLNTTATTTSPVHTTTCKSSVLLCVFFALTQFQTLRTILKLYKLTTLKETLLVLRNISQPSYFGRHLVSTLLKIF